MSEAVPVVVVPPPAAVLPQDRLHLVKVRLRCTFNFNITIYNYMLLILFPLDIIITNNISLSLYQRYLLKTSSPRIQKVNSGNTFIDTMPIITPIRQLLPGVNYVERILVWNRVLVDWRIIWSSNTNMKMLYYWTKSTLPLLDLIHPWGQPLLR